MIYKFTEVLNDLVNYFLLGDILLLEDWKQANHLSDDLAMEFTTNESGDRVFAEGIVIPMTGIENYPYTILFNLSGDRPELCKERNRLQLRKSGYSLKVAHNIYGSVAQSESENISANVKWGKARSAKEGNVPFHYKHFLGYRRGVDGSPEIVPEEAEIVRTIYDRFLSGDSFGGIIKYLEEQKIPSPSGLEKWQYSTIQSILSNEKYKGDAVINKTYIEDCISKRVRINHGERPKYYVENNHPAIIDAGTFGRVQEELARRSSKRKVKQVGTKTEQGKYSSKYALTELLVCGECGTPYRRCTWTIRGQKKIVWRCINRLDYGKKYCHSSPSVEESILQNAIMNAVMKTAKQNVDVLQTLKLHIGMGLEAETTEDKSLDIQIRIAEIDAEFKQMLKAVSAENADAFDEERLGSLMNEKQRLTMQLEQYANARQKRESAKSRLDQIFTILDGMQNHPMEYDDQIVRQIIENVVVESKDEISVVFIGGLEVREQLTA